MTEGHVEKVSDVSTIVGICRADQSCAEGNPEEEFHGNDMRSIWRKTPERGSALRCPAPEEVKVILRRDFEQSQCQVELVYCRRAVALKKPVNNGLCIFERPARPRRDSHRPNSRRDLRKINVVQRCSPRAGKVTFNDEKLAFLPALECLRGGRFLMNEPRFSIQPDRPTPCGRNSSVKWDVCTKQSRTPEVDVVSARVTAHFRHFVRDDANFLLGRSPLSYVFLKVRERFNVEQWTDY